MAIAFVQCTTGLGASGTTDFGSYTNGVLVVALSAATDPSALTINGVAGTRRVHDTSNMATPILDLWTVPVGTMSGSVSWSWTGGSSISTQVSGYSGADQSTTVDQSGSTDCAGCQTATNTITPTVSNSWAIGYAAKNGACAGDSAVNMENRSSPGNPNALGFGDSNAAITISVAYTQSVTGSGCNQQWSMMQLNIREAAAAGPANVKTWDGAAQATAVKTYMGNTVANTKTVNGLN